MKLNLVIEKLEQRIAPGGISTGCCCDSSKSSKDDCSDSSKGSKDDCGGKEHGNNGFGNGGDDGSNAGKQDVTR